MTGQTDCTIRKAAYDLRKLRGKQLAGKPGRTCRYLISAAAARIISALLTRREHVIAPLLAGVANQRIRARSAGHSPREIHCDMANGASSAIARKAGYRLDRIEKHEPAAPRETGRLMIWVRHSPGSAAPQAD